MTSSIWANGFRLIRYWYAPNCSRRQITGVRKNRMLRRVPTIGGTSRKRADTSPRKSITQARFIIFNRRPTGNNSVVFVGYMENINATPTKTRKI